MGEHLAIVIPCFNAGDRLKPVVENVRQVLDRVIVVDDGCTDGSTDGIGDLGVEVLSFPENHGKGFGMMAGFTKALELWDVDAVGIMDADGQHDPEELPRLYEAFDREDADMVIGSRDFSQADVPWASRFGNRITIRLSSWLMGGDVSDTQSGYRLYSRRLLESLMQKVKVGRYETEMDFLVRAVRGDFKVVCVPIRTIYEEKNRSSHFRKLSDSTRIMYRFLSTLYYSYHQE